jgi:hypothetical protein
MRSLVVLFLVGCGSHTTTVDALSADDACSQISTARCTHLQGCSAALLERRWADVTQCEMREKLACTNALAVAGIGATPESTVACAQALAATTCDDFLFGDTPQACLPQMGPGATGAPCEFAAQCASAFCALAPNTACGTCQAAPVAGSSCAAQGCGPTMVCVASTMQCAVPLDVGGACSRTAPCRDGLACVGATMTAPGTCTARATTVGALCDPQHRTGTDCNGAAGVTCDTTTRMCVMQPYVAAPMTCGLIAGVDTLCTAAASCEIPIGQTTGTCVAPAGDGAACDITNGPDCLFPARCVTDGVSNTGTCQLPGATTCP